MSGVDHTFENSEQQCVSCGNVFVGRFCNVCGEKTVERDERTIVYFLGQMLNAITFTDSKFLKSLKLLFTKPGFLAMEFVTGRRNLYTKPLSLFFIGNLIYFILRPVDTFTTNLDSQMNYQFYSSMIQPVVQKKIDNSGFDLPQLRKRYNQKSLEISKLLLILMVFLFSLPLALLYAGKRRFYYNHVIFSLSFITFLIYSLFIMLPYMASVGVMVVRKWFIHDFNLNPNSMEVTLTLLFVIFIYLYLALRRFYQQPAWLTIPKTFLLTLSMAGVVIGYRFTLFFITIALI